MSSYNYSFFFRIPFHSFMLSYVIILLGKSLFIYTYTYKSLFDTTKLLNSIYNCLLFYKI